MKSVSVIPAAAAAQVAPWLRAAGWNAVTLPDRTQDDLDAALDVVRRGDPVLIVPDGAQVTPKLERIVVVHEGNRGDRAGLDAADDAALASAAEVVVLHLPASTSDPSPGSLALPFADHGDYDLAEWRQEFLRRFCRCSPGVRVTLRMGAGSGSLLHDQVRSESPDLVIVSGPPMTGSGDGGALAALLTGDVPVLVVPSVGRDRAARSGAERGQRKGHEAKATSAVIHVRDVMTTPVISVDLSTPLKEVAQILSDHRISGVPVVGPGGEVSGVVTEADFLVKAQGTEAAVPERRFAWLLGESTATRARLEKLAATEASEAMTTPAITTGPDQPIADAARLMSERSVNRLPVVEDGKVIGIVTRADIVRTYLRPDDEIARTVREHVLRTTLWEDPGQFVVDVRNGHVSIVGTVDHRSTAQIVERFVRMVPGVVDVDADISWSIDDADIDVPTRDPVFPFGPR